MNRKIFLNDSVYVWLLRTKQVPLAGVALWPSAK